MFIEHHFLIHFRIIHNFETGMYSYMYSESNRMINNLIKIDNLYKNRGDLKKDFIEIKNLDVDYFFKMIICYVTLNLIIFVLHYFEYLKERKKND